jgi:hypothetical protein
MKTERTECSGTLAFKLQTPGNNPKENIRHSKQGESLKSRITHALIREDPGYNLAQIPTNLTAPPHISYREIVGPYKSLKAASS